jgi:hypothetical protein
MAFNELELRAIDESVGELCRRCSPARVADQLRTVYEVDGHVVRVFEERPGWDDPSEWTRSPVARFRFFRSRGDWVLYWMGADSKWDLYDPDDMPTDLASLVAIVDEDRYCVFFG